MDLNTIFQDIIDELDILDEIREKLMVLSRQGIRACSEAIKKLHRSEGGIDDLIGKARSNLEEIITIMEENPKLTLHNYLSTLFQEYIEARVLKGIMIDDTLFGPSEIIPKPPALYYILGLCDVIGELRRTILDCIRQEKFNDATRFFEMMELIHDNINSLDYPNGIIPNVRHKTDVNRRIINTTRSDLTMALHMNKLNENLSKLK
ncbi:MAG: hypothetical protein ACTSVI_02010 [Promethearchaeota archaeon]